MKSTITFISIIIAAVLITACPGIGPDGNTQQSVNDPFTSADAPGDMIGVTAGSTSFNMIYANAVTDTIIPTATNDLGTATINTKFFIAETETTNALMVEVLQWAYDNSRFSTNVGDHNGLDTTTVKHGGQQLLSLNNADIRINYSSGSFTIDPGYEEHPVTNITWYGAIMFCNWLTEMRDGNTDNLVYTSIDTDWLDDETVEDKTKTGYRLPGNDEWEFAARYRDDAVNTVAGYSNPWFTIGNSASGATSAYNEYSGISGDPGKTANATVAVFYYFWDGDSWELTGVTGTSSVKTKTANSLGICDMSGNVWEWCYTEMGAARISRGGSWFNYPSNLPIGMLHGSNPDIGDNSTGLRIVRTQ